MLKSVRIVRDVIVMMWKRYGNMTRNIERGVSGYVEYEDQKVIDGLLKRPARVSETDEVCRSTINSGTENSKLKRAVFALNVGMIDACVRYIGIIAIRLRNLFKCHK